MRWLERSVDRSQMPSEELDAVARSLEAAAHEAPPSRRAEEIRASLLAEVDGGVGASAGVGLLALAAVAVLLAFVVSVGAPAVGSLLDSWFDRSEVPGPVPSIPAEPSPSPFPDEDDLREPIRSGPPSPSASDAPIGPVSPVPGASVAPVVPTPTPVPGGGSGGGGGGGGDEPSWPPTGPPPTLPVPPGTGPPPGVPGSGG